MSGGIRMAVDVVVAGVRGLELQVLLVQRTEAPFARKWALPGVAVGVDEELEDAAQRAVTMRTGLAGVPLRQVLAFGGVGRDPRNRVVSVCHATLVNAQQVQPVAGTGAARVQWWPVDALPALAFDHAAQCAAAVSLLRSEVGDFRMGFDLLGARFTLLELQQLHETVTGQVLDKPNFRRRVLERGVVQEVGGEMRSVGRGRPAQVYRVS